MNGITFGITFDGTNNHALSIERIADCIEIKVIGDGVIRIDPQQLMELGHLFLAITKEDKTDKSSVSELLEGFELPTPTELENN